MSKKEFFLSTCILTLFIIVCCSITVNKKEISNLNLVSDRYDFFNKIKYNNIVSAKASINEKPIARLIIKKIKLNNYLYNINSKNNNVNKNVTILNGSTFPDDDESTMFIAAHSGHGKIAYFKNLDKLNKNENIELIYKHTKYTYSITDIFLEKKDGDIEVNKISKHQLTLTTCSERQKDMQLIINSILIKKEEI